MSNQCRICAKTMISPYLRLGYTWASCQSCMSVQKILEESEYQNLTPSYDPGQTFSEEMTDSRIRSVLGVEGKKIFLSSFRSQEEQSFLDIGAGAGGYLLAARDLGFKVQGIEPSASHSEVARTRLGLPVMTGYFVAKKLSEKFGVVMLSHVIEHIYDPAKFLAEVFQVLEPGGVLIVVTPNVESLSAIVTGKYWSMLKPVDHVTMLGKRSISICKPPTSTIVRLYTHEWPGEFAAHLVSALKQMVRPSISNVATGGPARPSARKETIPVALKGLLALVSFPFFLMASVADRQSCLTAVFRKQ